ncbi:MAG: hypothetical protein GWN58_34175, partial [Anaerolineae bacterium]|nr:hypothetical protein [Anaerolineae bacterium]
MLRPFETQQAELDSILSRSGTMFQTVTLLDDGGNELAKVSKYGDFGVEDLGNQADSPAFAAALEGQVYVDTQTRQVSGADFPAILMAAP